MSPIPSDAIALLALWPALDDDAKAKLLRMARALAGDRSNRGADA
ncbi:MAG: hypothetical protein ACK5PZ_21680 [Pirellula sp.]